MWNKHKNKEKMKMISSSGMCKAIYLYGSYILLFEKTKFKNFEILYK